jgi:hypothetical protein
MPFCTIVEFEWADMLERERFEAGLSAASADAVPDGRLTKIVGIDDAGARVVEVWRSGEDARAFAERSAPAVAEMPAPSRLVGFDVTSYVAS